MSVSYHAGLLNLQLRHCGHLGIKFTKNACSIRIWQKVIFENFVTKVPFRLTLLSYFLSQVGTSFIYMYAWYSVLNLDSKGTQALV